MKLGLHPKDVSFRKVWYTKGDGAKRFTSNNIVTSSQNWPLRGLYWLSKDLVEAETEFSRAILPGAKQIASIRNFIEHKSFKIIEIGQTGLCDNGLTSHFERSAFEQKIFVLMQMARSAIMYLSFAIHLEELKKENEKSLPIPFFILRDEYKR